MPYSLKGRNVLVTGGSRGLGALICEKFAEEGANIMINYVSAADRAEEVKQRCEKHGVKAAIIQGVRKSHSALLD
jgi:NAD(P)-dependent dehydrogenase (short-subunit alcohol dehydrogenase family)